MVPPAAHQAGSVADVLCPAGWESEIAHTCSVLSEAAPPPPQHISSILSQGQLSVCELGDLLPHLLIHHPLGLQAELREWVWGTERLTDRGPPDGGMLKGWKMTTAHQNTVQPDKPQSTEMSIKGPWNPPPCGDRH